jgi:hypothetical protein
VRGAGPRFVLIRPGAGREAALALATAATAVCAGFAFVRPTNFGGYDEWLVLSLASRGILSLPFQNRPLELLWDLPAVWLTPHDLLGFKLVEAAYLALGGVLVFRLARRLGAGLSLALVAGALAASWAPNDFLRLDTVLTTAYAGVTFGALLAIELFAVSLARGSLSLLALALFGGVVAGRGYESALPLLLGAPVLLPREAFRDRGRARTWLLAWEGVVVAHLLFAAAGLLGSGGTGEAAASYQAQALGLDAHPAGVAARLGQQLWLHLGPLVATHPASLRAPAAGLAAASLLLALLVATRFAAEREAGAATAAALMGRGALLAVLGYSMFLLTASTRSAARTQFLSGPGIALLLAGAFGLAVSLVRPRLRAVSLALLGSWTVAVGATRTVAMQGEWDVASSWPAQRRMLAELVRACPALEANTALLVLDERGTWPATFTLRHAVSYLYPGQAVALVVGGYDLLYPSRLAGDGLHVEPWPIVQRAWGERPSRHRYDEIVVVREGPRGLEIQESWPEATLGPLPPGTRYAPRMRIGSTPPPPARRVLDRP